MTKNDITRGLIDFAVSQCLKNIKEDPYRSIRRLADLGRQFAKGRFQEELFSLFQRLLLNEDGPYYEMLKQLVSSVDTDSLKTLGINIGYNSWTCGASRLRQITAEKDYPHWLAEISLSPESSASQLKEQLSAALKNGTYAFRLHMPAQSITTDTLGLSANFLTAAFSSTSWTPTAPTRTTFWNSPAAATTSHFWFRSAPCRAVSLSTF